VAGTFQNPAWNAAASNMVSVAAHVWQFDASLASATNFQFKFAANGNWTASWGDNVQAQFAVPLAGTGQSAAGNIQATGTFNGVYRFTFNDQTLAYSLVPLLASPYASMTAAGAFNGWNTALTNMTLVTNSLWQFDTTFAAPTNFQFKFAANGNWTSNWGDNTQTQTNPPLSGTGQSFGTNISASITTNGAYRFSFNDQTLAYSLQPLAVVAIPPLLTGPGFSGGGYSCVFTSISGAHFSVLATTNLALPLSNWTVLGAATEFSPGQYQFTDSAAAGFPRQFYRVRSP